MVSPLPLGQLRCNREQREEQEQQEEVDEDCPEGRSARPNYQEEEMPRPEDVRRHYLNGPLLTLVLRGVGANMEEVGHLVQVKPVDNQHEMDVILLGARKDLSVRKGVRVQVEAVVLLDKNRDPKGER